MLDYKDIIVKHYVLHLTGAEIARQLKSAGRESLWAISAGL